MVNLIPRGAYVILCRGTSKALNSEGHITTLDEELNRDSQIWWIEADPGFEVLNGNKDKSKEGGIYRICNLAIGQSLECSAIVSDSRVAVAANNGAPWQLWRIKELPQNDDG